MTPSPIRATPASIAALHKVPASAKAVLMACANVRDGALLITLKDGRVLRFGDAEAPQAELVIRDYGFARRVLTSGDIGFAEGWMAGEWDSPDLSALLTLMANNIERFRKVFEGSLLGKFVHGLRHLANTNTKAGSKRNILAHYDLGNRFYETWLDRTMTYSSALYRPEVSDLEAAQTAKYRALAEHLELKAGEHVLEIGCGWGGFAEFAAREYGARVTGITISDEQYEYARARMQRAGLSHLVEIRKIDYRDIDGEFDKVASIEMFEAVGEKYWPAYFAKINEVLKPGGRAGLQIITIDDKLFHRYRKRADFIQRYVFPGGMLASVERLRDEAAGAGLLWREAEAFGQSYAKTLAVWGERFQAKWNDIAALGFDERFRRLWLFYLGYCEAGFRTGRTDVVQLELAKPA